MTVFKLLSLLDFELAGIHFLHFSRTKASQIIMQILRFRQR